MFKVSLKRNWFSLKNEDSIFPNVSRKRLGPKSLSNIAALANSELMLEENKIYRVDFVHLVESKPKEPVYGH